MPRFVILEHTPGAASDRPLHWDLMLEHGPTLWTWALDAPPVAGATVIAQRLADHRLHYLEYTGLVSGDRGHVARWDEGTFDWVQQPPIAADTSEILKLVFQGARVQGQVQLRPESDQASAGGARYRWVWVSAAASDAAASAVCGASSAGGGPTPGGVVRPVKRTD